MDFSYTDEQQMLLETTRRFITERYGFDFRHRVRESADGWSGETWKQMAELGLLAINIPEADGGIGAGPVGTMLVANAVGEGLLLEPFLDSVVVATHAVVALAQGAHREQWLGGLSSGELIGVLAHAEEGGADASIETRARSNGEGWQLDGRKAATYHASAANLLLVTARLEDGALGLFAVPADAAGVTLSPGVSVDGQCLAAITLTQVQLGADARLGGDATEAVHNALSYGMAALCAEAFGAMDKLLAATIAYTRTRVQFGVPIGSFQALQHRMAEMLMHLEQARSMCYLATSQCDNPDRMARDAALSTAKVLMGQAARFIGQQAVQLHGGMGMTDELDVSHYFKRLLAFELRFGTTDEHLESYRLQLQAA